VKADLQKKVMRTRIIAEIISSMSYERLRVVEGGSWGSDCLGRAMSEAVVCGGCLFGRNGFGRTRHRSVAQYLCRLRRAGRVMSGCSFGFMERHGTAYPTYHFSPGAFAIAN